MLRISNLPRRYIAHYSNLSKACWQGIFLNFIQSLATGICYFLSLYFVNVLNFSMTTSGFLISSYGAGTIFGSLLAGKLSDTVAAKKISAISLFIQSIAFFLLTQLHNEKWLLITMFFNGFCAYGFITSNNVWTLKNCVNEADMRLKVINIRRAVANLGMGVSGFIIGFLTMPQFNILFYGMGLAFIFSAFYLYYFTTDTMSMLSLENNDHKKSSSLRHDHDHQKKIIFVMLNCVFLINLIIAQLSITYPIYIQQTFPEWGTRAVSILFLLDTLLIVFFQTPLVNSLKNCNSIFFVGVGALLMGLGMYVLNFSFLFYMAILSCLIWTTGEMIFISMSQFVCYEAGGNNKKGHTMGMFQATTAVARIIGPVLGGYIYYVWGPHMLWSWSMIIGVYCLLLCGYFKKYELFLR